MVVHGCYIKMHERPADLLVQSAYMCGGDDGATPSYKHKVVHK